MNAAGVFPSEPKIEPNPAKSAQALAKKIKGKGLDFLVFPSGLSP
jgi:hypothetical protein